MERDELHNRRSNNNQNTRKVQNKKSPTKKKCHLQTILPGASLPLGDCSLPCDIEDAKPAAKLFDYNPRQLLLDDVLLPKKGHTMPPVTVTQESTSANNSTSCSKQDYSVGGD
jgi:hypothetical protein